ncbi:MAG: hypothetical protein J0L82_19450 [Deltaproteobacteria bacterium]|jgi:hypothetical protein|nr:hypothetical protein [Deltaproteobacteria bacterium]
MAKVDLQIVSEIRAFDFIARNIWPSVRWLFAASLAPRCSQCVISSRVPGVFLTGGVCNLCLEYNRNINRDEEAWREKYTQHQAQELNRLLTEYQEKGKGRYDAIILFSGGRDSTYMLNRIRKNFPKLRLLLMTWDNGFYSAISLQRSLEVAQKLDIDHIRFQPKSSVYKTLYRYTLQNVGNKGSYQTVDRLDGTLNQFLGFYYGYMMNIPLVLAGVDFAQEQIMQFHSYFEMPFEDMCSRTLLDRMERKSGFKISDIFSEEDQKLFWDGTGKDPARVPRYILPLVAWRPDKSAIDGDVEIERLLPKRDSSPILTNNQVLAVMTAIDIKTIGYCSFEPEFSEMIRYRENDPVYWRNVFELVELAVKRRFLLGKIIEKVLGKLELKPEQVGLEG